MMSIARPIKSCGGMCHARIGVSTCIADGTWPNRTVVVNGIGGERTTRDASHNGCVVKGDFEYAHSRYEVGRRPALDEELKQTPVWLERDRQVVKRRAHELVTMAGEEGWAKDDWPWWKKFNPHIDVLIGASIRAH